MSKTFLLDYDLYLIKKHLQMAGVPVELPQAVPISANAPENYRVYFATPTGEITLGIDSPAAGEILFLKGMHRPGGEFFIFVLKGPRLIDVITPSAQTVVNCLSLFAERNVLRPLFQQDILRVLSLWREQDPSIQNPALAGASNEDILDFVYRDSS